ncbi:nucleoside diphosphate kinase [Trichoderma evansii]
MPEPHHEGPASSPKSTIPQPKKQQRYNPLLRWTTVTVTLPPPIFFVPLLLAAIYFLFSSSPSPQIQQSCSLQPVPQVQTASLSSSTSKTAAMSPSTEQTFIAIKPDGVQRGLIGPIITRFEQRGFKLAAIKLVTPGKAHLEAHYADLAGKDFFPGLIEYMNSGPICAMIWEGRDAVKTGRTILGATNPLASAPGTIRGDYAIDVGRNVCHGSDTVENAQKEIALWFKEGEPVSYKASQFGWIYEKE